MLAPAVGDAVAEIIVYGYSKTTNINNLGMSRFANKIEKEHNVV